MSKKVSVPAICTDEDGVSVLLIEQSGDSVRYIMNNGKEVNVHQMKVKDFHSIYEASKLGVDGMLDQLTEPTLNVPVNQKALKILEDMKMSKFAAKTTNEKATKAVEKLNKALGAEPKTSKTKEASKVAEKKAPAKQAAPTKAAKAPAKPTKSEVVVTKTGRRSTDPEVAVVKAKPEKQQEQKKAPAKQPAPAKEEKVVVKGGRTLKSTGKANDCRPNTFCHAQVAAMQSSKTVEEAQAKLDASGYNPAGRRVEIAWAVKKGYVEVV